MALLSEAHFLRLLGEHFPNKHSSLVYGRGDDCAILNTRDQICLSTDLFLEDVHFRRDYFSAEDIAYKALAVNISDIAAMGAKPLGFSLGLGISPKVDVDFIKAFLSSMSTLAKEHNMVLVGGDLARSDKLHICITIWGEALKSPLTVRGEGQSQFLTRGGAMPGDTIFLVGSVGLARVGLAVLEAKGSVAIEQWPISCAAHLRPKPLVQAGLTLARVGLKARPPVLMDVSDGLAKDLPRLLGMNEDLQGPLGAQIVLPESLLHAEIVEYSKNNGLCASSEAWYGGEDYALLGACAAGLFPLVHTALPTAYSIGVVTSDGVILLNDSLAPKGGGFDHFTAQ